MTHAMIFDAVRTPRGKGKKDGSLHSIKPVDLLGGLLNQLQARHDFDPSEVDDVVMGCVRLWVSKGLVLPENSLAQSGLGRRVSRRSNQPLLRFRLGSRQYGCAKSGQWLGRFGGGWRVSRACRVCPWARMVAPGPKTLPPTPPQVSRLQGIGADLIATLAGWSREDVDQFALTSQQRATAAQAQGKFDRSVMPVCDEIGLAVLERDEFIKPRTTMQALGALKSSFAEMGKLGFDAVALSRYPHVERINHVHTAGNSSGIVDGAAAVLIGSEAKGKALGLKPRGRIVATAFVGCRSHHHVDGSHASGT
jgi:acetyl-CoA C-acetyltransferase